jgi:hypothetical protein
LLQIRVNMGWMRRNSGALARAVVKMSSPRQKFLLAAILRDTPPCQPRTHHYETRATFKIRAGIFFVHERLSPHGAKTTAEMHM